MPLTDTELAELRQQMARASATLAWRKANVNAALQTIETWFEANRAALGAAIEAAAPGYFNATQKKQLVAYWLEQKFRREGVA